MKSAKCVSLCPFVRVRCLYKRPAPLPLLKLDGQKRWPLCGAASFTSHRPPLGQISRSVTVYHIVPSKGWVTPSVIEHRRQINTLTSAYTSPNGACSGLTEKESVAHLCIVILGFLFFGTGVNLFKEQLQT